MDEARKNAVYSVKNILSLARACRDNGQYVKTDVVSTVGVAGKRTGLKPEKAFTESCGFHNTYEAAKAEAERILYSEMENGSPVTIHRPSMVVGDSQTGHVRSFQVFYHLCNFFSGRQTRGIVPRTGDFRLDIIPVDYVARVICTALKDRETIGRIFHLASGPDSALPIPVLQKHTSSHFGIQPILVPLIIFDRILPALSFLFPIKLRKLLRNLPYFLTYIRDPQLFDNHQTNACFSAKGLHIPNPQAYLDTVLKYYTQNA